MSGRHVGERRVEVEAVAEQPSHHSVPFKVQTRLARVASALAGAMISISSPAATRQRVLPGLQLLVESGQGVGGVLALQLLEHGVVGGLELFRTRRADLQRLGERLVLQRGQMRRSGTVTLRGGDALGGVRLLGQPTPSR